METICDKKYKKKEKVQKLWCLKFDFISISV